MLTADQCDLLCVVLARTRNPLNLGAAARAMSNFGFLRLRVVNPYELAFREARSAVGAAELLANAQEYAGVAEAVEDCTLVVGTTAGRSRELPLPLVPLSEAARLMRERLRSGRVALLFGSEKTGLSNQELSHCHYLLRIPTREEHPSMNLGQAVAVCLYELARVSPGHAVRNPPLSVAIAKQATAAEQERFTSLLMDGLQASGYLPASARGGVDRKNEEKLRRLVRRLNLRAKDTEIWLGMLRKMLWKMNRGE